MLIRIGISAILVLNLVYLTLSDQSKLSINLVKHHAEELSLKENNFYSRTENLNLHNDKTLKRKVKHYLNDYFNKSNIFNHSEFTKSLIHNKKFLKQLYDYLSRLFYVDLVLYKKVNYEKKNRIVRKIFQETNCELEINLKDDKNWQCFTFVKESVNEIQFCSCTYEYDCDYNEQLQLGFSTKNLTQLFLDEVAKLCEKNLNEESNDIWSCKVEMEHNKSTENQTNDDGDKAKEKSEENDLESKEKEEKESICECTTKKKCQMQKILEHD